MRPTAARRRPDRSPDDRAAGTPTRRAAAQQGAQSPPGTGRTTASAGPGSSRTRRRPRPNRPTASRQRPMAQQPYGQQPSYEQGGYGQPPSAGRADTATRPAGLSGLPAARRLRPAGRRSAGLRPAVRPARDYGQPRPGSRPTASPRTTVSSRRLRPAGLASSYGQPAGYGQEAYGQQCVSAAATASNRAATASPATAGYNQPQPARRPAVSPATGVDQRPKKSNQGLIIAIVVGRGAGRAGGDRAVRLARMS